MTDDPTDPVEDIETMFKTEMEAIDRADAESDVGENLVAVPDPLPHIDIDAMVNDLEIGELKLLEKATGLKLAQILHEFDTNDYGADVIAGVVWISLRREDPKATIEDADRIKLRQIAEPDDDDDDDDDVDDELLDGVDGDDSKVPDPS